jgi:hypothetical protein
VIDCSASRLQTARDMRRCLTLSATVALVLMAAARVDAHHEALFGPQSALALSGEKHFTAQVFTRQTGTREGVCRKPPLSSVSA